MNIFKVTSVNDVIVWFLLGTYITNVVINEIWEFFLKKTIRSDIYSDKNCINKTRPKNRLCSIVIFVFYLFIFNVVDRCDYTDMVDTVSKIGMNKLIDETSDIVFLFIWMGQTFGYIINSIWYRFAGKMLMSQFDIEQDSIYNELRSRQNKMFILLELVITLVTFIFIGINEIIDYSKFVG